MAGLKRITDLAAAGSITGDELLEVSQLSTTVFLTATTISANASDNSYNDSAAGFLAAGFVVGDRVNVSGFTGDTDNNILVGTITALTTGKMTIGGADGDVIVNDAAGESVTISKWTSRRLAIANLPSGGGGGGGGADIRGGFKAIPTISQILDSIPIVRDVEFAANFAGSFGWIGDNPTSTFVVEVLDDSVVIGTITISTSGTYSFATTSGTSKIVAAGSLLQFRAPSSADASVNRASWTLKGEQV